MGRGSAEREWKVEEEGGRGRTYTRVETHMLWRWEGEIEERGGGEKEADKTQFPVTKQLSGHINLPPPLNNSTP